jgi:hypothetical protein
MKNPTISTAKVFSRKGSKKKVSNQIMFSIGMLWLKRKKMTQLTLWKRRIKRLTTND